MSFRRRLTLFFLLIVVLPMIAVAVLVVQVSGESSVGKSDARLASALETAIALYQDQVLAAEDAVQRAAGDRDLQDALVDGDQSAVRQVAAVAARAAGLKSLQILDPDGRELARVGPRQPLATAEVILEGAAGGTLLGSVTTPTAFADRVRELSGRQATLSFGGRTLASTTPVGDVALPPEGEASTIELGGSEKRAASAVLRDARGESKLTVLGPIESTGLAGTRPLVAAALAVFFTIALAFIVMLLRTLQGQVSTMLAAARRIGGGDFSRTVPAQGNDELAGLAREFNKMSDRLEAQMSELRRQRVELDQSIRRLGEAFASGLDRRALLEIVVETAQSACDADYARLALKGGEEIEAGRLAGRELREALAEAESSAMRSGGLVEGASGDAQALAHPLTPVGGDGAGVVGVMAVARGGGRPFSNDEREVLRYLIGQASVSIENIGLHELVAEQAVTDELTGLANNRGFRQWIQTEVARAGRFGHQLSLLMLDIDDFKQVNDTYGHPQGDEVLRAVGRVLRRESRNIDEPARYGGEEFAVALPETGIEGAVEVGERIRSRIEHTEIPRTEGDGALRVTASLGAASLPAAASDLRTLIAAADEALYRAKRAGKNRVEVSSAQGSAPTRRN